MILCFYECSLMNCVCLASHTGLVHANKEAALTRLTKVNKRHLGDAELEQSWEQSQVQHHGVSMVKKEQGRTSPTHPASQEFKVTT